MAHNFAYQKDPDKKDFRVNIKGIITDSTDSPIQGVNIQILQLEHGSISDKDGNFLINDIKPGNYTIKVSHISYETITKKNFNF